MKFSKLSIAIALTLVAGAAAAQTTLGTGAVAQSGVAIGNGAISGDVAAGTLSPTQPAYTGGIAIGNGANASGKNVAIGQGISAPQDGIAGFYTFAIGGLNSVTGTTDFRRIVGVASGMFSNDGANMQNVWDARDLAISTARTYTNTTVSNALLPVNFRLGSLETQTANNTTRLDQHDVVLADHETRITTAQSTADTALTVASGADTKATTAISQSSQALTTANQARQEVANLSGQVAALSGRIDEVQKDSFRGTASAMAMSGALPSLAPGERSWYLRSGVYGGQAAISGGIAVSTWSGHVFDVKVSNDGKRTGFSAGVSGKF